MSDRFLKLFTEKAIQDLKSNKTIAEKEANYFLLSYKIGEILHTTLQEKELLEEVNNIDGWFKTKGILTGLMLKSMYQAFRSSDEAKQFFKKEIYEILQVTEDEVHKIVYEIKYLWEYEAVLYHLYLFGWDEDKISTLKKRDRKRVYDEKRKFESTKNKTIEFLKANNLSIDTINRLKYDNKEKSHLYVNYESTLKIVKELLYTELTETLHTGKERAKQIIKILEYI